MHIFFIYILFNFSHYRPVFLHLKFHTHDDAWRAFEILQNELNSSVPSTPPQTTPVTAPVAGDTVVTGMNPSMEQSSSTYHNSPEIQTNKRTIGTGRFRCPYICIFVRFILYFQHMIL